MIRGCGGVSLGMVGVAVGSALPWFSVPLFGVVCCRVFLMRTFTCASPDTLTGQNLSRKSRQAFVTSCYVLKAEMAYRGPFHVC